MTTPPPPYAPMPLSLVNAAGRQQAFQEHVPNAAENLPAPVPPTPLDHIAQLLRTLPDLPPPAPAPGAFAPVNTVLYPALTALQSASPPPASAGPMKIVLPMKASASTGESEGGDDNFPGLGSADIVGEALSAEAIASALRRGIYPLIVRQAVLRHGPDALMAWCEANARYWDKIGIKQFAENWRLGEGTVRDMYAGTYYKAF